MFSRKTYCVMASGAFLTALLHKFNRKRIVAKRKMDINRAKNVISCVDNGMICGKIYSNMKMC